MCLAFLHSRKFTLQVKLEKCQAAPPGFETALCLDFPVADYKHHVKYS